MHWPWDLMNQICFLLCKKHRALSKSLRVNAAVCWPVLLPSVLMRCLAADVCLEYPAALWGEENSARATEFYSWEYWISTWIQTFNRRGGRQPMNRPWTNFACVYKKVTATDFWDWTLMRSLISTLNRKWLANSEAIVGRRSLRYIRRCVSRSRSRSLCKRHARRG